MKQGEGPPMYIHEEKHTMSDINFEFLQRSAALMYCKTKAGALSSWEGSDTPLEEENKQPDA